MNVKIDWRYCTGAKFVTRDTRWVIESRVTPSGSVETTEMVPANTPYAELPEWAKAYDELLGRPRRP